VDAIWLTPFYVSPQVDNGYDVANYTAIDPAYGTLDDFDELVAQAKARGIRIVLDMVLNHTSTEHAWFRESLNKEPVPPVLYLARWRTDDAAEQLALEVWRQRLAVARRERAVLSASVRRGAGGSQLGKPGGARGAEKGLRVLGRSRRRRPAPRRGQPDLQRSDLPVDTEGDGRRFYTDGPRVHEFLQEMSRDVFTPRNLMTVGEMSSTSLEHCQQYAALDGRELSMTFNFHHLKVDYPGGEKWTLARPDYVALKALFRHWQQGCTTGRGTRCSGVTTISRASCRALATKGIPGAGGENAGDGAARHAGHALYLSGRRDWHDQSALHAASPIIATSRATTCLSNARRRAGAG
jgi:trehalose-6-phosphate hydrolase